MEEKIIIGQSILYINTIDISKTIKTKGINERINIDEISIFLTANASYKLFMEIKI